LTSVRRLRPGRSGTVLAIDKNGYRYRNHVYMRIAREEIFGPVLTVIAYRTEEEAIEIANGTTYGLQAYVLSADLEHVRAIPARLDSGRVVEHQADVLGDAVQSVRQRDIHWTGRENENRVNQHQQCDRISRK
jgi:hypothetical protein